MSGALPLPHVLGEHLGHPQPDVWTSSSHQFVDARRRVGELVRFDHIMTRAAGQRLFVNLHMHVPALWTLARAARGREQVERALLDAVPGLHASIQLLPADVEPLATDLADAAAPPTETSTTP